jgi:hypothetical protein
MSLDAIVTALVGCLAGCGGPQAGGPGASVGGPAGTPRELADQVVAALAAKAPDGDALALTVAEMQRHCPGAPPAELAASAEDDRSLRAEGWQRCAQVGDWTGARVIIATGGAVERAGETCPGIEVLDTIEVKVKLSADEVLMTLAAVRVGGDVFRLGGALECVVTVE